MNFEPLLPLANHLWQSTLFAGAAGLLTLALRGNHARIRYWVWFTASCKFLIPLSLLVAMGSGIHWRRSQPSFASRVAMVIDQAGEPFPEPATVQMVHDARRKPAVPVFIPLLGVWACGFLGIGGAWWIRWRRIRTAVRASLPLDFGLPIPARSSLGLLEPGIFGVFRPVLMLPDGIRGRLTQAQLEAVIEHELCHVRHRENLMAATQMFIETVFWFHPLVWWMGKRMVEERERACDEEVVRLSARRVYAESILEICKFYAEVPLACVSGMTGADLKKRIAEIMAGRSAAKLSRAKKLALALAGMAGIAAPVGIGMLRAPFVWAQAAGAAKPRFEVAAIKPCDPHAPRSTFGGTVSHAGVNLNCSTLETYIRQAYVMHRNNDVENRQGRVTTVEGGPPWINRDLYSISAKAPAAADPRSIAGAMMQSLLEDRFKVKVHFETREVPVYALEVAKSGLRLPPAKVPCFVSGSAPRTWQPGETPPPFCGNGTRSRDGLQVHGSTMADFALAISGRIPFFLNRRSVIDRTGVAGKFDFDLTSSDDLDGAEPGTPRSFDPNADYPRLRDALAKVGLLLEPSKGPGEFLVIDHAERPSEN